MGPFGEVAWPYVFGGDAPMNTINNHAVRDYLGLDDMDRVDWQFVEASAVPAGPWKDVGTESPVNGRGLILRWTKAAMRLSQTTSMATPTTRGLP